MLDHPQFKPHLRVEVVPGEGAFVVNDGKHTLLRGRLYEVVAPCVDGRASDDICERLQAEASPAEVYFVLNHLERKGFLCERADSLPAGDAAFWSALLVDPGDASRRLKETPISLQGSGEDIQPLCSLIQTMGVRVVEREGRLGVIVAKSYLSDKLKEYNAESLAQNRPWLLVRPRGRQIWIGPLFRPGVTGCLECLADRLRSNSPVETYLRSKKTRSDKENLQAGGDPACTPATLQIAWGLAANAIATWIVRGGELPSLEGKIQTFDVSSLKIQSHTLIRLPYCKACGAQDGKRQRPFTPLALESRPKTVTRDGGHRVVSPEATLERYGRHISPITGAVTMLERVGPESDQAMHVYIAGHNLANRHHSLGHLRGDLRNMSSGKGASDVQARASGLCEGLERHSAVFRGDEPRQRDRFSRLGDAAISLDNCLLFSERQYRERDDWNSRESRFNFVPLPFDPEAEIEWSPVWSLTRREARYLPTAFCYFDYPQPASKTFCRSCSNGNAAGNILEEAILQGFLELVERDAVALWWYNRIRMPGVDLNAVADPYLDRLRDYLHGRGRELWVLDLTSDLGVPVFAALTRAVEGPEERIVLGFGAHFDAEVALMRAVTEMNQMLSGLPFENGKETLADHISDVETVRWLRTATSANQPYVVPGDTSQPRNIAAFYPRTWADDVLEDVRRCQGIVERQGMEMLVLDQTRPEIGLPVVKVIVPGLRHFWSRFAPGRLYDVPVRQGLLARPTPEEELNPIPMFL